MYTSDATVATLTASGSKAGSTIDSISNSHSTLTSQHTLTDHLIMKQQQLEQEIYKLLLEHGVLIQQTEGDKVLQRIVLVQINVSTSSSSTLTDLRDAINNAVTDSDNDGNKDALASIIYDGSNYMLMPKVNQVQVTKMRVTDNQEDYAYDTTDGAKLTQRVAGVNAAFTVDGISMTRTTNSVDDLFDGFTLDLKTSGMAVRISSEVNLTSVKSLIDSYVLTYNDVTKNLTAMGANDPSNDNDGALIAIHLREIMSELREMSSTALSGYEGGPTTFQI